MPIRTRFRRFLKTLGPGIITGAADDDPSGIATYSQTGAQFGYGQLWTALFMLPFQTAVQEACARIGTVTGKGIAAIVKEYYSKKVVVLIVSLLIIANTINIGTDIGAMAAATQLLLPVNFYLLALTYTAIIVLLQIFIPYKRYANFLKWLCLSLLAYPLTLFMIEVDWKTVTIATFVPHFEFNYQFLFIITGVLGTTISPYLFFWEASQEVEEEQEHGIEENNEKPKVSESYIKRVQLDNFIGMLFSEITTWSIILVGAAVLHKSGVTDIKTAADAAKALEPFVKIFPHSGLIAEGIFALGIIGLGLLSVPVLAGSVAYAFGESMGWRVGLNFKFNQAHGFYSVILVSTLIGLLITFIGINPIKALVYTAVINGVVAVPLILLIAIIANDKKIMNRHTSGIVSNILIWITFIGMALTAAMMFIARGKG